MNIPGLECLGTYKVADASKTDVEPTFHASSPFSCCVKLKQNSLNWKWALLLNTVLSLIWKMISCPEMLSRLDAVSVSERQYFLYVCRQPYCPVWGWGFLPAGPQYKHRGPRRALRRQEPVQITLQAPFFSFIVCTAKKLLELAEKWIISSRVWIHSCCPSLSPRPGPLWHRISSNCCFTNLKMFFFFFPFPIAVFLASNLSEKGHKDYQQS